MPDFCYVTQAGASLEVASGHQDRFIFRLQQGQEVMAVDVPIEAMLRLVEWAELFYSEQSTRFSIGNVVKGLKSKFPEAGVRLSPSKEVWLQRMRRGEEIAKYVCGLAAVHFEVLVEDILNRSKFKSIVAARRVVMYLIRRHTNLSYPQVGLFLNIDHASVILGCRIVVEELGHSSPIGKAVHALEPEVVSFVA